MKLYFTFEIGDESSNRTWILMSSVILIQLKKLFISIKIQCKFQDNQFGSEAK